MNPDRISRTRSALLSIVVAAGLVALVLQPALAGPQPPLGTSPNPGVSSRFGAPAAQRLAPSDDGEQETPGQITADEGAELMAELRTACAAAVAVPDLTSLTEDQAEALLEPMIEACEDAAEPSEAQEEDEAGDSADTDEDVDDDTEVVDDAEDAEEVDDAEEAEEVDDADEREEEREEDD